MTEARERYRRPQLRATQTVEQSDARLDALKIKFENIRIRASSDEAVTALLFNLSEQPLFKAVGELGRNRKLCTERGWLFGGQFKFQRLRNGSAKVVATLELNLTRFLAHTRGSLEELYDVDPAELLVQDADIKSRLEQHTLDGSDNFLPSQRWGEGRDLRRWFRLYIHKVTELIGRELRNAADGSGTEEDDELLRGPLGEFDRRAEIDWSGGVVGRSEVYWEYEVPDALTYVHHVAPRIHALAGAVYTDEHGNDISYPLSSGGVRYRTRRNSISIKSEIGRQNVELVIYSKTPDIVRFEIRFKKSLRGIVDLRARRHGRPGNDLDGLVDLIWLGAEEAQERLQRFIDALPDHSISPDPPLNAFSELVMHLSAACRGDESMFRNLLCALTLQLAVSDNGGSLTAPLRYLARKGVVERRRPGQRSSDRRYVVTERYSDALQQVAAVFGA